MTQSHGRGSFFANGNKSIRRNFFRAFPCDASGWIRLLGIVLSAALSPDLRAKRHRCRRENPPPTTEVQGNRSQQSELLPTLWIGASCHLDAARHQRVTTVWMIYERTSVIMCPSSCSGHSPPTGHYSATARPCETALCLRFGSRYGSAQHHWRRTPASAWRGSCP